MNVLRCLAGGALQHVGFSLERVRANHERMRSTQHSEATKLGMAAVAATNPAARLLMDADAALSATGAITKLGMAAVAATDPAAQRLMAADASRSAPSAVVQVAYDSIKRATEDDWAKRQRQEAALGPAFAATSVAQHLFR